MLEVITITIVVSAWLCWAIGGTLATHAEKLAGNRPASAGFSFFPAIPMFPLLAVIFGLAIDAIFPPWGLRSIGIIHVVLLVIFVIGITREVTRIRGYK